MIIIGRLKLEHLFCLTIWGGNPLLKDPGQLVNLFLVVMSKLLTQILDNNANLDK